MTLCCTTSVFIWVLPMERTSCFDTRTQFLPGQLVLNPRSVSRRHVTAPMVPLCFHLHSGLCRGQRSQLLHKTCCVCCCSLVLLLQDKHKEMALHWAHLCTQSAHRASHQTLCAFVAKANFTAIAALCLCQCGKGKPLSPFTSGSFQEHLQLWTGCGGVRRKQYHSSFFPVAFRNKRPIWGETGSEWPPHFLFVEFVQASLRRKGECGVCPNREGTDWTEKYIHYINSMQPVSLKLPFIFFSHQWHL